MENFKNFVSKAYKAGALGFFLIAGIVTIGISSYQTNYQVYKKAKQSKAAEVGKTYYVSPSGSDSNNGTESLPWKTINKCVTALSAGDTCVARGGTYTDVVDVSGKSGSSGAPITLKNYPSEKPIIDGINATGQSTMQLKNMKYFVMDGITVANSRAYGIYTENSQYITAKNCEVAYPQDGGLIWKDSSNILVDSCDVHHTNDRGNGSHEAVSFADTSDFEIKNSTVRNSKEEGIDAKYGAKNGLIHHNRVFGNNGPNVYVDGASFVKIYNNEIFGATGDKPNISIAGERPDYVVKDISIYNNIVYNSAGGISFFIISMPTPFENIDIYHNLMYNNTSRGGLRTNEYAMNNVVVKNNIFWRNFPNIDKVGNAIVDNNLFNTGADARQYGTNARMVDNAGFVNESGKNFHLNANSLAINAGTDTGITLDYDGTTRPQGVAYDIGPYEFSSSVIPPTTPPSGVPSPTPTVQPTTVIYPTATPIVVISPTISTNSLLRRETVSVGSAQTNTSTSVSTNSDVPIGNNRLYLAAISTKPNIVIGSVYGLGLGWQWAGMQCAGRSNTRTDVWWAYGSPKTSTPVTAVFSNKNFRAAVIAVVSYSGAGSINNTISKNSIGVRDVKCSGGSDQNRYSLSVQNSSSSSIVFGAVGLRQHDHAPLNGFTEIVELHTNRSNGDDAGIAVIEKFNNTVGFRDISGTFSSSNDYSVVGLEILPR